MVGEKNKINKDLQFHCDIKIKRDIIKNDLK